MIAPGSFPPGKKYKLLGPEGAYEGSTRGTLGGNSRAEINGRLDCKAANNALPGYAAVRAFFADEAAAIAAGYRPCGQRMRERYRQWKAGGTPGAPEYPWLIVPVER